MPTWDILEGDCREALRTLPAQSVHTCVTSPPYYGLRDYGHNGQLGLEATPDEFVTALVEVFREVRRVLRDDGIVWLNLGDSYAREPAKGGTGTPNGRNVPQMGYTGAKPIPPGMKPKDLIGIPWMVAFALRADGWYLRQEIIWHKPNPMPESVTDRPTRSHEQVFLLSKSARYYYDADAIREAHKTADDARNRVDFEPRRFEADASIINGGSRRTSRGTTTWPAGGRNKRSVWTVATQPYSGAHFATFPPKLIEPCVLAGCPEGGTVLDPLAGAGTTGLVALRNRRSFIGIELSAEYAGLARERIETDIRLGHRSPQRIPVIDGHGTLFDGEAGDANDLYP